MVEGKNLTKVYKVGNSEVHALRGVNIKVEKGNFVAIMGPSGSGKSTLLHILGCLDKPTFGEYYFDGVLVNTLKEDELAEIRNRKIGFVFQNFYLLGRLTVLENVELAMLYSRTPRKMRVERAMELLKLVGLERRAFHKATEISGGEAQRVAIARALANDPILILADEPTGNLDSKTGGEIMKLFTKLNEMGKTIVLVTHNQEVASYSRKVLLMRDGYLYD